MRNTNVGQAYSSRSIARASQSGIEFLQKLPHSDKVEVTLCVVNAVNPQEMTCDLVTSNGSIKQHVPILAKCGLDDATASQIWGEFELPAVHSTVVVLFILGKESFPVIIGTLYPFATNLFQAGQTPVNSSSKQFTKSLLQKGLDAKTYRRIFKSGTSIEVQSNGTIVVETPSGGYFELNETNQTFVVKDAQGNIIQSSGTSITLNGNLTVSQ
jgi:hypothetical protein